jgi:hypothetical protein
MESNDRTRELVAAGASIVAKCRSAVRSHVGKAGCHAHPEEVAAAGTGMDEVSSPLKGTMAPIGTGVVMEGNGYQYLGP